MTEAQLLSAANSLGFNLLPHIHKAGKTTVFFPCSVTPVTAMLLAGAGDGSDTQKQLRLALGLQSSDTAALGALLHKLKDRSAASNDFELLVENAIWAHVRYPLRDTYLDRCKNEFKSVCDSLDFNDGPHSAKVINKWADDNTKQRIKEVVSSDMFDDSVRLVAANATAFDGNLLVEFDVKQTRPRNWTRADGTVVQAPTMYSTGDHLSCWELGDCDVLKLGYKGDASMYLALPAKGTSASSLLPKLGQILDSATLNQPGYFDEVHAYVPKLKCTSDIKLIDPFRAIGCDAPFDAFSDFSAMIKLDDPNSYVSITDFFQKAMLEMDEKGARGAAVTVAIGRCFTTSINVAPRRIKTLRFDRPYIGIVRDDLTGLVIAIAVVEDPTAA